MLTNYEREIIITFNGAESDCGVQPASNRCGCFICQFVKFGSVFHKSSLGMVISFLRKKEYNQYGGNR